MSLRFFFTGSAHRFLLGGVFMKPLIGITCAGYAEENGFWLRRTYIDKISQYGGLPLLLPHLSCLRDIKELCGGLDGLLLSGGGDIDPSWWQAPTTELSRNIDLKRDFFELELARYAWQIKLPVFGICRGIQIMNVALGGSLCEDLPRGLFLNHDQSPPFNKTSHPVTVIGQYLLRILGQKQFWVNSCHHQCLDDVAPQLIAAAVSDDCLVEAVNPRESAQFFLGLQWHPEWLSDEAAGNRPFEAFLAAAALR